MRKALFVLLFMTVAANAQVVDCGTGAGTDARIRALHERPRERRVVEPQAIAQPVLRDGAFYIQGDDEIVPGYRPFDLDEQSLVFEPRGAKFALRREPLHYVDPAGAAVADFQAGAAKSVARTLPFAFPFAGRNVSKIYVTAFNSIEFDPPAEEGAMQIDALEAAVHRNAVVSPLLITRQKPNRLAYPQAFVDDTANGVVVTWRSDGGRAFAYDVQAELRRDGTIVFSYKAPRAIRWGAPVISAGFDAAAVPRTLLRGVDDATGELTGGIDAALKPMLDIVHAGVARIGTSELYALTIKLAAPVDATKLAASQYLRYFVFFEGMQAVVDVLANGTVRVLPFGGPRLIEGVGAAGRVSGDTIEVYGLQPAPGAPDLRTFRVSTYLRPSPASALDTLNFAVPFDPAPSRIAVDLSGVAQDAELALPIAEPFVLAPFDPFAVFEKLQARFRIADQELDAVAMYQSFYTDIIFWAGAYATGGNPQVDGIAPKDDNYGGKAPRRPSLLHMNQLTYGWSEKPETSSHVMLHEFGHRWLYFFQIKENGVTSDVLSPLSGHPAAYVDTRSAFPVYGDGESSVMGGASFSPTTNGWRARAANYGYSWTDLYLMGLASSEEVRPWFYLANTNPALPGEYYATDGIEVTGTRHDVNVQQILDVHGPRIPQKDYAQKQFRVAFVLVTEPGVEATAAEIAKVNEWRALMEQNFVVATGGRGSVVASFTRVGKPRAVR